MNERYMEALEQYEVGVEAVRRGRGAWLCETERGCMLLKEYRGTVKRLEFEDQVLGMLDTRTSLRADRYVRNREGGLLTEALDGTRYVLKEWFTDRECNIRDGYEVRQAVLRLAMLHRQLRGISFRREWDMGSVCQETVPEEMERHNRELQRARNFIRAKRSKSEFELCVMGNYEMFLAQAREAAGGLRRLWDEGACPYLEAAEVGAEPPQGEPLQLCHGDLDQHHVLMGNTYTAVIEYNRMHLGVQASDLYRFMRKVMEKHGWNIDLGLSMVEAYERVQPMSARERGILYYLFLYPEKYWKQLNFYYNAKKAWIPGRSTDKLRNLEQQQPARNLFLRRLARDMA